MCDIPLSETHLQRIGFVWFVKLSKQQRYLLPLLCRFTTIMKANRVLNDWKRACDQPSRINDLDSLQWQRSATLERQLAHDTVSLMCAEWAATVESQIRRHCVFALICLIIRETAKVNRHMMFIKGQAVISGLRLFRMIKVHEACELLTFQTTITTFPRHALPRPVLLSRFLQGGSTEGGGKVD